MLGKMTPLKIDTCNVNSLKFRSMRLEDSLSHIQFFIKITMWCIVLGES